MLKIIPAILSHTPEDLAAKLAASEPHFAEAHLDLMDGVFVSNKTVGPSEVRGVTTNLKLEAHLMVSDPAVWIERLAPKLRRVIVHQEIGGALPGALRLTKSLGLEVGLAINPESDPLSAKEWWGGLDLIQVMGVIPGHYGGVFQPAVTESIRLIRESGWTGELQVDGGVTPETATLLSSSGIRSFVVGHYLFGSEETPELAKIGEKLEELKAALVTP